MNSRFLDSPNRDFNSIAKSNSFPIHSLKNPNQVIVVTLALFELVVLEQVLAPDLF